jgi:hypothetical protein
MTVDEMRARESLPAHADPTIGNAPLNSSLTGIYMQGLQGSQGDQEDFGQPPGEGADAQEQAAGGAGDDNEGQPGGPKQGDPGEAAQGEAPQGQGQDGQKPDFGKDGGLDFGKAMGAVNDAAQRFGLPLVKIWGDE